MGFLPCSAGNPLWGPQLAAGGHWGHLLATGATPPQLQAGIWRGHPEFPERVTETVISQLLLMLMQQTGKRALHGLINPPGSVRQVPSNPSLGCRELRTEVTEHVRACAPGCCFLLPQSTLHPPTPRGGPYLLCLSSVHGWGDGGKLRRQGIHDETALPLPRIPSLSQSLDPSPTQTAPPPHSSLVIQSPPPDALHLRCHLLQEDSSIPKTSLCLTSHSASSPSPWAHLDRFIG